MNSTLGTALSIAALSLFTACAPAQPAGDAGQDASNGNDGSVELCSATLASTARGCGPANVGLSAELCRCGSKFYWDGATCAATAACRCTSNCELLFDTQSACESAYAVCRDASVGD